VSSQTMSSPQGPMEVEADVTVRYPGSQRRVMKTPMGEMTMVITPDAAFVTGPMGTQDAQASQRDSLRNEMKSELIAVLKNAENPAYTFTVTGTEKIGDVNAQILEIGTGGGTVKWYVDPATGRILRRVSQGRMGEQTTDYTEWKTFGGLN